MATVTVLAASILAVGLALWVWVLAEAARELARWRRSPRRCSRYPEFVIELKSRGWRPMRDSATWWEHTDEVGVVVRTLDGYQLVRRSR